MTILETTIPASVLMIMIMIMAPFTVVGIYAFIKDKKPKVKDVV